MATVTVYTAARMKEIEDKSIVGGAIVGNNLILTKFDSTQIDTGAINILTSPNGTKYRLVVSDAGVLSTVFVV